MKQESILKNKSFQFGLKTLELCRYLKTSEVSFSMTRQLERSGTAIGALIAEAEFAQSKADFINKLSIALKEANETRYWMTMLSSSQCVHCQSLAEADHLLSEVIGMLVASIKTAKSRNRP